MNYTINDNVIHPSHGRGQVTAVKNVELVEGFKHYYVINIPDKLMTVYVPVGKMEELGFRSMMQKGKQAKVLETLRALPSQLSENYKIRQADIREVLRTGLPLEIAKVLRNLTWYKQNKSLTVVDQKLLNQAREALISEMAAVKNITIPDATQMIDTALQVSIQSAGEQ